jgi:hypothetical protein
MEGCVVIELARPGVGLVSLESPRTGKRQLNVCTPVGIWMPQWKSVFSFRMFCLTARDTSPTQYSCSL